MSLYNLVLRMPDLASRRPWALAQCLLVWLPFFKHILTFWHELMSRPLVPSLLTYTHCFVGSLPSQWHVLILHVLSVVATLCDWFSSTPDCANATSYAHTHMSTSACVCLLCIETEFTQLLSSIVRLLLWFSVFPCGDALVMESSLASSAYLVIWP